MVMFNYLRRYIPLYTQVRYQMCQYTQPSHLICFKEWTAEMVLEIIVSAMRMKCKYANTHEVKLNVMSNCKVMILQEVNQPMLNLAVSKAASLLGADEVNIIDHVVWEHDYNGLIFSCMADIIFVCTASHFCVQRFAEKSLVPVICMQSRTHATLLSLATIMAIIEETGSMKYLNIAYVGAPHPVLNSYLLLCPMLGANIRFKCCCEECPVSPLLYHASEDITSKTHTEMKQCTKTRDALHQAYVVISGPTSKKEDKVHQFELTIEEICRHTCCDWIYFHTCPRGKEVDDCLFWHYKSRTFNAFNNLQYIAAALMAMAVKKYSF